MTEVSELMARDPLKLTKGDRTAIICYYRENRQRFLLGNKAAGKAPKPEKEPKVAAIKEKLDLSSLDIEV